MRHPGAMRQCAYCGAYFHGEGDTWPRDFISSARRVHRRCREELVVILESACIERERNARQIEGRGT